MKSKKNNFLLVIGSLILTLNILGQTKKPILKVANQTVKKITKVVNNFSTIKIGDQEWMSSNLDVSHFRNGDLIPEAKTHQAWKNAGRAKKPAWCYPEIGYSQIEKYGKPEKYGKLYNYFAVIDNRGLAPKGWSVPKSSEWDLLIEFLKLEYPVPDEEYFIATGKENFITMPHVKNIDSWYWEDSKRIKQKNTNSSGFNAMPAGDRSSYGTYDLLGIVAKWWCLFTPTNSENYYKYIRLSSYACIKIESIGEESESSGYISIGGNGYSVRCIKETNKDLEEPVTIYSKALEKYNANDFQATIQEITNYINLKPKDYNGYRVRGLSKAQLNDWENAVYDFEEAWRLVKEQSKEGQDDAVNLELYLGIGYIKINNFDLACFYLQEAYLKGVKDAKQWFGKNCEN